MSGSAFRRRLAFWLPFARRRLGSLMTGSGAALGMVALRLVLPWPLVRQIKPWLHHANGSSGAELVLRGGLLFFGLFVGLGLCDYLARVAFARFAVDLVVDLRSELPPVAKKRRGDHLARLIGDTARLKEGLKGFLIHVATNGLLCVGLLVMLALLDLSLALIFGGALAVIVLLTRLFTNRIHIKAKSLRKREGRLAESIHTRARGKRPRAHAAEAPSVKPSRALPRASLTIMQGQATFAVHAVLGLAMLGCLAAAGPGGPRALEPEQLVVFMTYVLHSYHPIVRLARQGTRIGKLVAAADRVQAVFTPIPRDAEEQALEPLHERVRWHDFQVRAGLRAGGGLRLGPLELELRRGERLALVGPCGSGKSSLLASLARRNRSKASGQLLWDQRELGPVGTRTRRARIQLVQGIADLAPGTPGDVLLIDDAFDRIEPGAREAALDTLLDGQPGRTMVVAMRRPLGLERFDRVVRLEAGCIQSQGAPR